MEVKSDDGWCKSEVCFDPLSYFVVNNGFHGGTRLGIVSER